MLPLAMIFALFALAISSIAAFTDARSGRIANWLTLPPLLGAPLAQLVLVGPGAALGSLLGAVAAGLCPYVLFRRDAMGGGDVKLFAALGALMGPSLGLEIELLAFVAMSAMALVQLAWRGQLTRALLNTARLALSWVPGVKRPDLEQELLTTMRMGPAIFVATAACLAWHPELW